MMVELRFSDKCCRQSATIEIFERLFMLKT